MSKQPENSEDESWTHLVKFEGIFPLGSEMERLLLEKRREFHQQDPDNVIKIRLNSDFGDNGIVSNRLPETKNQSLPKEWLNNSKIGEMFDLHTLVEIEFRVRWCRALLSDHNLLDDDQQVWLAEEGKEFSYYTSDAPEELRGDGCGRSIWDAILTHVPWFNSPVWYAAKILCHFRRAEFAWENKKGDEFLSFMSQAREWMLFGETWTEAKAVVNFGDDALRGKKVIKGAKLGGEMLKAGTNGRTTTVLSEMQALLKTMDPPNIAQAARIASKKGFGPSFEANKALWHRHKKKK